MTRLYQPILEAMEITYPQYLTLLVLWEDECIDFKELSQRLELKTGTLTPIVNKLEAMGVVTNIKNVEDQRRLNVEITIKGMALKQEAKKVPEKLATVTGIDYDHYIKYVTLLDEIGDVINEAEQSQKGKK
jgi:DNA-binding MarR family transcriptional regulator